MQIIKTKSGRMFAEILDVADKDGYKAYLYFAIVEMKELIGNEKRLYYLYSCGYATKYYTQKGETAFKLDFDVCATKKDRLYTSDKFKEDDFISIVKQAKTRVEVHTMLYLFNKQYENSYHIENIIENPFLG